MSAPPAPGAPAFDADALFVRLVRAHQDLDEATSRRLDAALVLLLAERLADPAAVEAAIADARRALGRPAEPAEGEP